MLAAGHVLRWRQAIPRLAPEAAAILFERYLDVAAPPARVTVRDPFCGNGVILALLQAAYGEWVASLEGADVDRDALDMTTSNLDLLNVPAALERRIGVLEQQRLVTGNSRLDEAIADGRRLLERSRVGRPPYSLELANALDASRTTPGEPRADVILTDPPYGRDSLWIDARGEPAHTDFLEQFFVQAQEKLAPKGWIGLALDRACAALDGESPAGFVVVEKMQLPRRTGYLLTRA